MDAEQLFARYFLPLYPAEVRDAALGPSEPLAPPALAALAHLRATDANPVDNPSILAQLDDAADVFVANAPALFDGADLRLDRTDASVHRLGAALTPARRDAWASRGPEGTPANLLFNVVVHGTSYVGACVVRCHGGAWRVRRPLWESRVALRSRAGDVELAVFPWWLRSLADAGQGATLGDRYRAYVEVPRARPEDLPPLVSTAPRALPRLKSPRYTLLHKYLRAHLPEVKDLGDHFPSPERFDAYAFRWVDFHVLGGGRMLLLAGLADEGLALIWVSAAGFEKSAFYPCDALPEPVVRASRDRLQVMTSEAGTPRAHEMLWWGP